MKFILLLTIILSIFGTKFVVTNQINQIKKLKKEISQIDIEIEKLKTNYSYLTSPKNLKNLKKNKLDFFPIEQKDIIKLEDK